MKKKQSLRMTKVIQKSVEGFLLPKIANKYALNDDER